MQIVWVFFVCSFIGVKISYLGYIYYFLQEPESLSLTFFTTTFESSEYFLVISLLS